MTTCPINNATTPAGIPTQLTHEYCIAARPTDVFRRRNSHATPTGGWRSQSRNELNEFKLLYSPVWSSMQVCSYYNYYWPIATILDWGCPTLCRFSKPKLNITLSTAFQILLHFAVGGFQRIWTKYSVWSMAVRVSFVEGPLDATDQRCERRSFGIVGRGIREL